jgi:hypothetical protein
MKLLRNTLALTLLAALASPAFAAPWTYNGQLNDNGQPANGKYDVRLTLVNDKNVPLSAGVTLMGVDVQKGTFTTKVDFGLDPNSLPGARLLTEVQQGNSGFFALGEAKAINGGAAECWDRDGNDSTGGGLLGISTATTGQLLNIVSGSADIYLRNGGGVEQEGSTAGGASAAAWNSSSAAGANSFTVGRGQTQSGATNSFVYSSSAVNLPGALSAVPNEFLVRAEGGIGLNYFPFNQASVTIGPRPGETDKTLLAFAFDDNFSNNITADKTTGSITFNTFRSGSLVDVNSDAGLRVSRNGIALGSGNANGFQGNFNIGAPRVRDSGIDLVLTSGQSVLGATGRIGLNRLPTANSFEVAGNASKDTSGSWLANSDGRIKTNIQSIPNALDRLSALRPVTFSYTKEYLAAHPGIKDQTYFNVIAQEFQKVFPDAVQGSGEYLAGKQKSSANEILQVDTYPAQIVAIAAIQELNAKLEIERSANAALKARLEALEAKLAD